MWRKGCLRFGLVTGLVAALLAARAQPLRAEEQAPPSMVIFAGVEPLRSPYGGFGFETALGGHLWESGWRFRHVGGIGSDRFDVLYGSITGNTVTLSTFGVRKFTANDEVLAGYQWIAGPLALRVLAGAHVRLDILHMPGGPERHYRYGATASADLHARLADGWSAEIASRWSEVGRGLYARAALMRAVRDRFALGAEVAAERDEASRKLRLAITGRVKLNPGWTLGASLGPQWERESGIALHVGVMLIGMR